MPEPLDTVDRAILDTLTHDARMSVRQLAESLHISRASAYSRLKRLQSSGVIRSFRADIDPVAYGFATSAYITLNVEQTGWREVRQRLRAIPGWSTWRSSAASSM